MARAMDGFIASYYLQVMRFWRTRARLMGSIVQPVFWMIFFGIGFTNSVRFIGSPTKYIDYLVPGVILMSVFMASFLSGMSVIWDREFGFLKVILVSPTPRKASILGRVFGDATVAIFQGLIISVIAFVIAPDLNYSSIVMVLGIAFLVALSTSCIGIMIASRMRSFEGFGLIVNLISMPLVFASGVFYPVDAMPDWMKLIAYISPLTYGADAVRELMIGIQGFGIIFDVIILSSITAILLMISISIFERTTIE